MEEMGRPLVSIITINYNNAAVTEELIESLQQVSYPNFEILVIDNGSDESPDRIKQRYPHINLIKTGKNLGFAGGNNIGFQHAKGKYFLMLNNDTEVESDFINPLVDKLESDPKAGVVSSKLIYFNSDSIIQYAGSTSMNMFTGRSKFIGQKEKDSGQYNACYPTHFCHGAAMMIPRKVVQEVGLMADLYFLYYEELDFCERIRKAGYTLWYTGLSKVLHKESMSVGKESTIKAYYMTRNRLLFLRRNGKGAQLAASLAFFTFISMPKNILTYASQKRYDLLKAALAGYIWNWKNANIHSNPKLEQA
jgi:GT2 family glycosyltransferase